MPGGFEIIADGIKLLFVRVLFNVGFQNNFQSVTAGEDKTERNIT